jgi:hypothetical protein
MLTRFEMPVASINIKRPKNSSLELVRQMRFSVSQIDRVHGPVLCIPMGRPGWVIARWMNTTKLEVEVDLTKWHGRSAPREVAREDSRLVVMVLFSTRL